MRLPVLAGRKGWQPLTPPGVAAFAAASLGRLLLVQFVFAALAGGVVVWFLAGNWLPTIDAAIQQLPPRGEIRSGRLQWAGDSPRLLAEGNYLAFIVDLDHTGKMRSPAHVQVEFGRNTMRIFSLFGYLECGYPNPRGWTIAFNRTDLGPWWGAWAPPLLWLSVAATIVVLMGKWTLLATAYAPAVRLVGFYANRDLDLAASWKLAGAALMPGTLLLTMAIILYGLGALDLLGFTVLAAVHCVAGWAYSLVSPLFAPPLRSRGVPKDNPFQIPAGRNPGAPDD